MDEEATEIIYDLRGYATVFEKAGDADAAALLRKAADVIMRLSGDLSK